MAPAAAVRNPVSRNSTQKIPTFRPSSCLLSVHAEQENDDLRSRAAAVRAEQAAADTVGNALIHSPLYRFCTVSISRYVAEIRCARSGAPQVAQSGFPYSHLWLPSSQGVVLSAANAACGSRLTQNTNAISRLPIRFFINFSFTPVPVILYSIRNRCGLQI